MGPIGMPELLVILFIVLLLFGTAKIPQLMRGLGQGISEFKKGIKEGDKPEEAQSKSDGDRSKGEKPAEKSEAPK